MAQYLGYNPERLNALKRALPYGVHALDTVWLSDPLALEAHRLRRGAIDSLKGWINTLDAITSCYATTQYQPFGLDPKDLTLALATGFRSNGWRFVSDTGLGGPATFAERLMATQGLAEMLVTGDVDKLLDTDAERQWLAAQLSAIAADDRLTVEFLTLIPAETLSQLCDRLSSSYVAGLVDSEADEARIADVSFAAVGAILSSDQMVTRQVIASAEPLAGALLLGSLDLDDRGLAEFAEGLFRRQAALTDVGWIFAEHGPLPIGIGDLLLPLFDGRPGAAALLLRSFDFVDLLQVLNSTTDLELLMALYRSATDPATVSVHTAGALIVELLRVDDTRTMLLEEGHRAWLGELITPYVMQFTASAEQWPWESIDEADRQLLRLAGDDAIFAALVERAGVLAAAQRSDSTTSRFATNEALDAVTTAVVALMSARAWHLIGDARDREALFEQVVGIVELVVDVSMLVFGPTLKVGTEIVLIAAQEAVSRPLDGILRDQFGIADPNDVENNGLYLRDVAIVSLAWTVTSAWIAASPYAGTIELPAPVSSSASPMSDYDEVFDSWLASLDIPDAAKMEIIAVRDAIQSEAAAEAARWDRSLN